MGADACASAPVGVGVVKALRCGKGASIQVQFRQYTWNNGDGTDVVAPLAGAAGASPATTSIPEFVIRFVILSEAKNLSC